MSTKAKIGKIKAIMFSPKSFKYAFVLGRVPLFSRAEIACVLEQAGIEFTESLFNQEILVVETRLKLEPAKLQSRLGGTIKIARLICRLPKINPEVVEKIISQERKLSRKKKFLFGFSLFGGLSKKEVEKIGLAVKRNLRDKGISSRFVVSQDRSLSSVIIAKEKLTGEGLDLLVIKTNDDYLLAQTESIQEFQEFSGRDYGRPSRDDKSGLLPPKLARMMINLSKTDVGKTILDPFCGSGTVIQEALFLGYRRIIGSDVAEQAVEFSRNNIEWLKTKYQLDISGVEIYQLDAVDLPDLLDKESIDAIVTEPYLGPPEKLQADRARQIISELSGLYLKAFKAFHRVLKESGRVVMILPVINSQQLAILEEIAALGFEIESLSAEPRGSLIYSRPNQTVLREIFVFRKK